MKMFKVPSNISAYIICSSKIACGGHVDMLPSMSGSSIWYSCPVCAYRVCSRCTWTTMETPPPLYEDIQDIQDNVSQNSVEASRTIFEKDDRKTEGYEKNQEKHSGCSPVPGMVE